MNVYQHKLSSRYIFFKCGKFSIFLLTTFLSWKSSSLMFVWVHSTDPAEMLRKSLRWGILFWKLERYFARENILMVRTLFIVDTINWIFNNVGALPQFACPNSDVLPCFGGYNRLKIVCLSNMNVSKIFGILQFAYVNVNNDWFGGGRRSFYWIAHCQLHKSTCSCYHYNNFDVVHSNLFEN